MLVRHRNVLNRAERLEVLKDQEKWDEQKSVFGLPKVAHRKVAVVKAVKEEVEAVAVEGAAPVAGAAPAAAPAAGAKPAPGAKAPAAAAAPAAKGKK